MKRKELTNQQKNEKKNNKRTAKLFILQFTNDPVNNEIHVTYRILWVLEAARFRSPSRPEISLQTWWQSALFVAAALSLIQRRLSVLSPLIQCSNRYRLDLKPTSSFISDRFVSQLLSFVFLINYLVFYLVSANCSSGKVNQVCVFSSSSLFNNLMF